MFESEREKSEIEGGVVLHRCYGCHEFARIHAFISYSRHRFGAGAARHLS
jgi:hypothetical protein